MAAHAKSAKDLEGLKALHSHHAATGERIEYLKTLLGDLSDKHLRKCSL